MAFQYYGGLEGLQYGQQNPDHNPYLVTQQSQQQQGGGMNLMDAFNAYQQFGGASTTGSTASGGAFGDSAFNLSKFGMGGGSGAGAAGGTAGAAGGSAGAAGGASSGASMMASAGPWALLAAAVIANESQAKKAGRRKSGWGGVRQALTGEGMKEDARYYGDKIGGVGGKLINAAATLGSPVDSAKKIFKVFK